MKNKKKQKTPGHCSNSCACPVANCHVSSHDWPEFAVCAYSPENRGRRWRSRASAPVHLRRVSGEGKGMGGCGGE